MPQRFLSIGMMGFVLVAGSVFSQTSAAKVVDRVVAVVNNDPITQYQLDKVIAKRRKEIQDFQKKSGQQLSEEEVRQLALDKLVSEILLEKEMKKRGIEVSDEDVEKAMESVLKRNNMSEEDLAQELKKNNGSLQAYKDDLRGQLKAMKFMGQFIGPRVRVTDSDLEAFFAKNPEQFAAYQSVEIAQILIPVDPAASEEAVSQARAKALEARGKVLGKSNFESVGKSYSSIPELAKKQSFPLTQLAPQILQALEDLQENQVSEPVRSNFGFHIVKLYSRKTLSGPEYEAIREQVRQRVYEMKIEEEMERYLAELKESNVIEIKSL